MSDEKSYATVLNLSHHMLLAEPDRGAITTEKITETVELIAALRVARGDPPVNQARAVAELVLRFSHWIAKASTLIDNEGHVAWLSTARKQNWRYWQRYQNLLETKMSDRVVAALDQSTDEILGALEDPKRDGPWDRRGMVVGHVQSGKTGNYSGLICKAADAGYKIIIVLAGMHNNLRSQTQIRLEESFLGYETTDGGNAARPVGVGLFDSDQKINPHCGTNRSDNGDFTRHKARTMNAISPEELPWLFVVKKNKTVLTQLLAWIRTRVADANAEDGRKVVSKLPLLVVDDEADHGSVDTGEQAFDENGEPDEEHSPTVINGLIRQILHSFSKSAYVGYTATPFANIFIHDKAETKKEGKDLFPEAFIINLGAPSNYIGPARIFGRLDHGGRVGGLPLMRGIDDHLDPDSPEGWMPSKHGKEHVPVYMGQEILPPTLKEAVYSFMIACAVRACRGQATQHSSMLVHVTRLVAVQKHVANQIEDFVTAAKLKLTREIDHLAMLAEMEKVWLGDFIPTSSVIEQIAPDIFEAAPMPTWSEVLGALPNVLGDIVVMPVNGTAKEALEYKDKEEIGFKVIAVGGEKLARGLTLEGLCTSYFVRTTKMYDTLMQMGRWFGYRPGYVDLCRLYTTPDLVEWFQHIADASEELREEFDLMAERKLTPMQFGLRVKSHEVMTITSPVKMRHSHTLKLSYQGTMTQTVALLNSESALEGNLDATDKLISSLPTGEFAPKQRRGSSTDSWPNAYRWKDVDSEAIIEFLNGFATPAHAPSAKSKVLAEFVKLMNAENELKLWTVALLAAGVEGAPHLFSNGVTISNFPSRSGVHTKDGYSIKVLTDPADEAIDVEEEPWQQALAMTRKMWQPDKARNRGEEPKFPSGKTIRRVRDMVGGSLNRGVLLLYPLAPAPKNEIEIKKGWTKPVMAFAMAFPTSKLEIGADYEVNPIYWEQEFGAAE